MSERCGEAVVPSTQYGPSVVEMPLLHAVVSLPEVVGVPLLELLLEEAAELLDDDELDVLEVLPAVVVVSVPPAPQPARPAILARLISRTASRREKLFCSSARRRLRIAARISFGTGPMTMRGSCSCECGSCSLCMRGGPSRRKEMPAKLQTSLSVERTTQETKRFVIVSKLRNREPQPSPQSLHPSQLNVEHSRCSERALSAETIRLTRKSSSHCERLDEMGEALCLAATRHARIDSCPNASQQRKS